ncbi:LysR family transcriptional regulator (plasmid) [Paroceanicella profunda]|uniref:LysR family transcriptional regulator n=1 Tax=Paroceanicella profunda TaxID=2579971 RepID=A0A5B8FJ05_9RHOB|nr:LysR family transcriptional regulator [Paroceanicella profunda]QDL94361.1 LysR family transcriptional regulator [Paroceanicella profunda]
MAEAYRDLSWDDFRLVGAIRAERSLPAAAARVGIAHSTMFRRLGQIEESLGTLLFERHRSGYVPTPAGEEMAGVAAAMEERVAGFSRRLAGQEIAVSGEIRVTTSDTLLVHLLTPHLAAFRAACPGVRLDMVLANAALNLSRRDADVAIRATDAPPETLVGRRVARLAWALYGPAEAAVPADLLTGCDWVSLEDGSGRMKVVKHVEATVPPERLAYRVNSVLGLAEAVAAGLGIGYLPCFIADTRPGLRRLAAPDPDFGADLWLLTHPDLRRVPRIRALLDHLAEALSGQRRMLEGAGAGA